MNSATLAAISDLFEYRPDLKGIKTRARAQIRKSPVFEYRPDLKGIKTAMFQRLPDRNVFEYRPDLKGIKTQLFLVDVHRTLCLNTALI